MKGRPPSRNKGLRDGFYIEVFNKGASTGIKIWKENAVEMQAAAEEYRKDNKTVIVHGEHRKGDWVNLLTSEEKAKLEKRSALRKGNALPVQGKKGETKTVAKPAAKAEPVKKAAEKPVVKPVVKQAAKPTAKPEVKKVVTTAKPAKKAAKPAAKKPSKPAPKKAAKKPAKRK